MKDSPCPACKKTKGNCVIDSRPYKTTTRRRRKCTECDYSWTTYEVSAEQIAKIKDIIRLLEKISVFEHLISAATSLKKDLRDYVE